MPEVSISKKNNLKGEGHEIKIGLNWYGLI
jgi:hypothetical protein